MWLDMIQSFAAVTMSSVIRGGKPSVRVALACALVFSLSACAGSSDRPVATPGAAELFAPPNQAALILDYKIGPLDKLNITVFQVKDLSLEEVQVDASGRILFPLIGAVQAAGRTPNELSADIAQRLGERYLVSPQVSVVVSESVSQKVTVEGAVTEAGVFDIKGQATLLQAIALAKGPSRVASLKDVAVFRNIDGKRYLALFDLDAIRAGQMEDPEIRGNDVVVVRSSRGRSIWQDVLMSAPAFVPALAVFYRY